MATVTVSNDGRFAQWLSAVREIGRSEVAIGLLSAKAAASHGDGVTNVDVGTWMEFGTLTPDGRVHVPARPFLRSTLDTRKPKILQFAATRIRRSLQGKATPATALGEIGAFVVGQVQTRIASNDPPFTALADSTTERKGSTKPLIDSGQLRSSITYEVRPR